MEKAKKNRSVLSAFIRCLNSLLEVKAGQLKEADRELYLLLLKENTEEEDLVPEGSKADKYAVLFEKAKLMVTQFIYFNKNTTVVPVNSINNPNKRNLSCP